MNTIPAYNISIDPGTNATGVCVWLNGKVVQGLPCLKSNPFTIRPRGDDFLAKLYFTKAKLTSLFDSLRSEAGGFGTIRAIAVEKFEGFNAAVDKRAFNKLSMIKCAQIAGMLLSLADDWAEETIHISKRQVSKNDTARLAQAYGVTGSRDALDAFQIGIAAQFDRTTP